MIHRLTNKIFWCLDDEQQILWQSASPISNILYFIVTSYEDPPEEQLNRDINDDLENVHEFINFALIFGRGPSVGVRSDTKLCRDFSQAMLEGLNHDMYLDFPLFMESIRESNASLELITSSNL